MALFTYPIRVVNNQVLENSVLGLQIGQYGWLTDRGLIEGFIQISGTKR